MFLHLYNYYSLIAYFESTVHMQEYAILQDLETETVPYVSSTAAELLGTYSQREPSLQMSGPTV